jgi:HlyD family secretion protein
MKESKRIKTPLLWGGIFAATVATGGILIWGISQGNLAIKSQTNPTPSIKPQPPKQITTLGRLEPIGEIVKLSAPLALDGDRLKNIYVREGGKVKAGQIIAVLDSVDRLQAILTESQQQVQVAQAKLAQIKAGAKPGEINAQKATISRTQIQVETDKIVQQETIARIRAQWTGDRIAQQAAIDKIKAQWDGDKTAQLAAIGKYQLELNNAKSELNRYRQLAQEGAISQSVLDSKQLAVATFNQQLREARAVLQRIDRTSSKQLREARAILQRIDNTNSKQITEAEALLAKIEGTGKGQLQEATANLNRIADIRPVDIQAAQAEVNSALATQARAQKDLDRAYIRAPMGGQILKINTRPGEKVSDRGIVDLGQTEAMMVVAEVYQTDIMKVKIGQSAKITSLAFPEELNGRVEQIGLQVNRQNVFSNQPGENLDRRVIEVRIKLDPNSSQKVANLTNLQVQTAIAIAP